MSSIGESDLLEAVNEIPKNLLNGLTFVLSGVFKEMGRDRLESFICEHGGRCTSAISGKTNYLVVGFRLEDGRQIVEGSKYKAAVEKKIPIFTELEFEAYIQKKSGNDDFCLSLRGKGMLTSIPEVAVAKESEPKPINKVVTSEMWTDRYKPKSV